MEARRNMADENERTSYRSPAKRPPRIRKKNQRFYNDDEDTTYSPAKSPRKQARTSTARSSLSTADRKVAQSIGVRLRNFLKLPKAHKWVCYEWFYSNLDIPLFLVENDFCICLKETFPQLKTVKLKKVEWCKIRRLMGKPRRCSPAFFEEERNALEARRNKIRLLQQRKLSELSNFKDLPHEIPMHLVIGTKVTARLRKPQDGLFTGVVDALDTVSNSYRITFDRPGIGTHSIPDYEVLSNEPDETIPLSAFQQKHRPRVQNPFFSPPKFVPSLGSPNPDLDNDPLLSGSPFKGRLMSLEGGTYGGFPIKFLVHVTKLSKVLSIKKQWIQELKDMNTQAEKMKSFQQPLSHDFQQKYANIVLELETVNKELNDLLSVVQNYCQELAPEQGLAPFDQPSEIRHRCDEQAEEMVERISQNMFHNKKSKNEKIVDLISSLTSLMLQVQTFSETEFNSFEFRSLQDTLQDIKGKLDGNSINAFKNNVEIHINHIQTGLSQMGNLHAFAASKKLGL